MRARLLSTSDERRIEALVAEIETRTAGEIVTLVVGRSDDYASVRALYAAALTVAGAFVAHLALPDVRIDWIFLAQAPSWLAAFWLLGQPALLRPIVSAELAMRAVDARAKQLFIEYGVTETRDRSGILILLSEAERRVVILADRGIHERLGQAEWQRDVDEIVAAIRAGRAAEGICSVLQRLGEELARAFPPRTDDVDELDNTVRRVE